MLRQSVVVDPAAVEELMDVLLPLVPAGVFDRAAPDGQVELAWHGVEVAPAALGPHAGVLRSQEAPDDPAERRRAFRGALIVAGALAIRGPEDPPGPAGLPEVLIDSPHGEFGTGTHPTTRGCLEALLAIEPGGSFADLGCGAGVLAIVAARMGYDPVHAVDFEPASVAVARDNATRNGVAVEARAADLAAEPPPLAQTYAANVPLAVHRRLAVGLEDVTELVIASGVATGEAADAIVAYERAGLREAARLDEGGWTTLVLVRPPAAGRVPEREGA